MKNLIERLKINRRWLAGLLVIMLMTSCTIIGICAGNHAKYYYDRTVVALDTEWMTEDGNIVSLSNLPCGAITLQHSVEDINLKNNRLCMKSIDTLFEVYADNEIIYSYYPEQAAFLGKSYGMYIHAIPIPENTCIITVKLIPIYSNAPPALLNTAIEDPSMFMGELFKEGFPGFCLCLLMFVLGIIMMITGIFSSQRNNHQQIEFFILGIFAVLVAVWSVNDTLILQTLTQNPAMVRLLNYMTLIFLPYFIVSFIASATNHSRSPLLLLLFLLICLNFLLNVILTVMKISDYYDLVRLSQAIIVIALGITAYFVISAVRKNKVEKKFLRTFLIGICTLAVGTGIDLIRFRTTSNVIQGTSFYTRMGSFLFLSMIGLYLIQENNRIQLEYSRELARLAYTDGLTGLKNRLAFHKAEEALLNTPDARCIIIQFDVNNLKKVNDIYGHAEGDRHIHGAASIIRNSISGSGECFRTGGDEFIAILSETDDAFTAQNVIRQMELLTQEYNLHESPPVLMDIAYGTAHFNASEGSLEMAEQLADQRMYACKRLKKIKKQIC